MFKETKEALEIIKQIKDIDFKILNVELDTEFNYDIINLKINEPVFKKRLALKHKIMDIVRSNFKHPYYKPRFFIAGAI